MISDPLILNDVEIIKPGIAFVYKLGAFIPSASFIVRQHTKIRDSVSETSAEYAGIVSCDYALSDESLIRVSSLVSDEIADLDAAFAVRAGKLTFDAELYGQLSNTDTTKTTGYYAGILFKPFERIGIALRYDGRSTDGFNEPKQRFAGGLVFDIKDGIFCAAEIAHVKPQGNGIKPYQEIQLQVGLQQKLELPGFQRKTLTKE